LITHATAVSPLGIAYVDASGMWTRDQMAGWKRVVDAMYAKGDHIFVQLWDAGRQAHPANTGGLTPVALSALRSLKSAAIRDEVANVVEAELVMPHVLEVHEIADIVEQFRTSAMLAKEVGFDCIELHGANEYSNALRY
jgi:N-ethylmaleimide reductase